MPANVNPEPFIIRPADDWLTDYPSLRRSGQELARHYASQNVVVTDDMLQAMGQQLWQAIAMEAEFEAARQASGLQILPLIIESDQPAIQQLPWETLYHPTEGFLGRSERYTLSRRIPGLPRPSPTLAVGPLRVLLFTTLPDDMSDTSRLAVEEEQARLQEALLPWIGRGQVVLEMPDDGRATTLQHYLRTFQPHLLLLSGHGKFYEQPHATSYATFLFEDEHGRSDPLSGDELLKLFTGAQVQAVILSACESGRTDGVALQQGLSQQLSGLGIPHVVGMRESLLDRAGILFARTLCDALAQQERLDVALQAARRAIIKPLSDSPFRRDEGRGWAEFSLGQWSLPLLISHAVSQSLIDWQFSPQPPPPRLLSQTLATVTLPSHFIGRRSELRRLSQQHRRGELRQLLVTGPGGQGKTALVGKLAQTLQAEGYTVLAYAARPESDWEQFIFELELMLSAENAQRYDQTRQRIGSDEAKIAQLLLTLLLGQSQKKLVLFLDNLETVQDADSLQLTDPRLTAWIGAAQRLTGQGLILLLTSRWRWPDWPPADHHPLQKPLYTDFLMMARHQLEPSFLQNRDRLGRLYEALHGNGRGLTFFAAAIQGMSALAETAFLEQLAATQQDVQIDMALARLIEHLSQPAAQLLERLPVYHTPVPQEGLIKLALLGEPLEPPEQLLTRLVDVSLVEAHRNGPLDCWEYQLSPVVAAWLSQHHRPPPAKQYWQAAADYQHYLFKHEPARKTLTQAMHVHTALQRADRHEEARRFALDWIVGRLSRAGLYHTLLTEWLPDICQATDRQTQAKALNQTGLQLFHVGDYERALGYLEQSLQIRQAIGDKAGEGTTLNNISQIYDARGDYKRALGYLEQSLQIRQAIGDKAGEGTTLNNISQIFKARGDYERALGYLEQSLKIQQEIGDKAGEGTTLNNISQIYDARGDYERALGYLEQSLGIMKEIGDKAGEGATLNNISQIYDARGDYERALGYLEQSLKIVQEIGNKAGEGTTLNNLATTAHARGDYERALGYLEQSLRIRQEIGDKAGEGRALNNISQIFKARGDYERALGYLEQSLRIRQEIGDKAGEGTTLNNISQIFKARGDYERALVYLEQSLKIQQEIGDKAGEGATLNNISQIFKARGDYERALGYLEQSLGIMKEIGDKAGLCATLINMGHIYWQHDEQQQALATWGAAYQIAAAINYAPALQALVGLAEQLGLPGGLAGWAALGGQDG